MKFCTRAYHTKSWGWSEQQVPIIDAHIAQTLDYLRATGLRLAIILDFSKEKLEYKRIVK
jgi:hypothetical protein